VDVTPRAQSIVDAVRPAVHLVVNRDITFAHGFASSDAVARIRIASPSLETDLTLDCFAALVRKGR
jgi:hypothetical protein